VLQLKTVGLLRQVSAFARRSADTQEHPIRIPGYQLSPCPIYRSAHAPLLGLTGFGFQHSYPTAADKKNKSRFLPIGSLSNRPA
jgi:hypothetical protein